MASQPVRVQAKTHFGEDFELDPYAHELRRSGRALKLERVPMELLLLLVEQRGQLVTREQIVERIWGRGVFLDTDNSINGAIRKIRHVLKDDAEQPRFIQTVTGRGYRFIAPVGAQPSGASRSTLTASPLELSHGERETRTEKPAKLRLLLFALAAVLLASLAAYSQWFHSRARPQPPAGRLMLAVLPFENLTGDTAQEYFSDGLTEEMISRLGGIESERLGIIARTSVMHYKRNQQPLSRIGRELGVQYVLEGSVRRDGDKVRIAAQLIQVKDQTHLWARQYDRELKGLLALQSEIAQEIADEIQLALGGHHSASLHSAESPHNYEAYDLYLKGQYFLNQRTDAGFEQAVAFFQQATAKDPNYAPAYAGLAHAYELIVDYGTRPPEEFISKARAAALKALEIDPSLPEAHTALALILQSHDWDWQSAEKEFRRAIELNPNYASAHHWYAEHLMWLGRFDEALQESERARQLDPLSLIIAADHGAILYYSRQYDRAIEKLRSVLEVNPDFPRAFLIVAAYAEKGRVSEALAFVEAHRPQISTPYYWAFLAHVYGRNGQVEPPARHALNKLLQLNRRAAIDPVMLAWACAETGENDQALRWLEKAYEQHSHRLAGLKVNPVFDPLRGDPRFQELMRRVGLAH